jgi:uncharacterized protein involved in type VI secretion and phage assembly
MNGERSEPHVRHFGVYPALVTDIVDRDALGRVQVRFPWLGAGGDDVRAWATLCSPYADDDQGIEFLPAVGTQVVVAFEAGDLRRPYILGATWNGREALPEAPKASNDKRMIKTRSGSLLEFDDGASAERVTLSMHAGHRLVLDNGGQTVTLAHANGALLEIDVAGRVSVTANSTMELTASVLNVHAPVANFDGMVTCTTVICNTGVVSPSYTPGAGNIW